MNSKSLLSLLVVLAVLVHVSLCDINCLETSKNILQVLPKVWSSLAWNNVTLCESSRDRFSDFHKKLMKESSRNNVNLRIRFFGDDQEQCLGKKTFILRCNNTNDDYQDLEILIKSGSPLSTLIAVTQNSLTEELKHFLIQLNVTTSVYLINIEQ
jgi:hypothetical protein